MLTQTERDQLAKKLFETAIFYGKTDLTREAITTTINVFETFFNCPFTNYMSAIDAYMFDAKNNQYPAPAKLRPYLNPELDDESKAIEVASRVVSAVSKFGWPNPTDARAYIGDLGWEAVRRFGGWAFVCENLGTEISITTFQAQVRDSSRAIIKTAAVGAFDLPIALPEASSKVLSLINIKTLTAPKNETTT